MVRPDLDRRRVAAVSLATLLAVAACGTPPGSAGPSADADAVRVVATTTVLADLVAQVGGPRVVTDSLVPKGGEVHSFDPTPSDVSKLANADLVITNGLGLDEWLADLAADSGTPAPIVELGEGLEGVELLEGGEHEGEAGGHEGEDANPHLWLNVAYAVKYVDRIEQALVDVDPDDRTAYEAGADAYRTRLEALHAYAQAELGRIPADARVVVSFHEAFPYFAQAYGLEIVGTIVDAPGQDPSAGEIADLVAAIRESGAKAIFAEVQFSEDLARTVADETGIEVISDLYNDSLGDPPVDTYEGMMRWNIDRVVAALGG